MLGPLPSTTLPIQREVQLYFSSGERGHSAAPVSAPPSYPLVARPPPPAPQPRALSSRYFTVSGGCYKAGKLLCSTRERGQVRVFEGAADGALTARSFSLRCAGGVCWRNTRDLTPRCLLSLLCCIREVWPFQSCSSASSEHRVRAFRFHQSIMRWVTAASGFLAASILPSLCSAFVPPLQLRRGADPSLLSSPFSAASTACLTSPLARRSGGDNTASGNQGRTQLTPACTARAWTCAFPVVRGGALLAQAGGPAPPGQQQQQEEGLDEDEYSVTTRLREEAESPFRNVRFFAYAGFAASGEELTRKGHHDG